MNPVQKISIDPVSVLKSALVLVLLYALFLLRDLFLVVLTAIVIASAIEPGARWLIKHKIPRIPAVIVIYISIVVVVFGIFYFLLPPLLSDMTAFFSKVPDYVGQIDFLNSFSGLRDFAESNPGSVVEGIRSGSSLSEVFGNISQFVSSARAGVFSTISTVFGGAVSLALIVVISFYLAVQERGIENFLEVIIPHKHQAYAIDLWRRTQKRIGQWMQGQLLLMLIVGILVFLSLTILGVKHALLFAILAAFFEIIPVFGPVLASVPAILVSFIDGGITLSLIVIGVYAIIQQFENHLIYPLVVHKVVGMPALLVILALFVGGELAGFLGVVLAVPIATALMEFVADIKQWNKPKKITQ